MTATPTITTKVETATSLLLDQLTFLTSPSAATMKSATEGLLINQKIKRQQPTRMPAGTIVTTHKAVLGLRPRSKARSHLYSCRQPKVTIIPNPKALQSLVYFPWPRL